MVNLGSCRGLFQGIVPVFAVGTEKITKHFNQNSRCTDICKWGTSRKQATSFTATANVLSFPFLSFLSCLIPSRSLHSFQLLYKESYDVLTLRSQYSVRSSPKLQPCLLKSEDLWIEFWARLSWIPCFSPTFLYESQLRT